MSQSLQDKVEYFLSKVKYITFAIEDPDKVLGLFFDKDGYEYFSNNDNYKNLRSYFKGKRMKFMVVTKAAGNTSISFVDTNSGDTINLKGPVFVNGNIHKFFASKLPENTLFKLTIMGKSKDNSMMLIPEGMAKYKSLEIHGYSVIDRRPA